MSAATEPTHAANLFLGTRVLTGSREDHLTEFVAAALQLCPAFALDYARLVLPSIAPEEGWRAAPFKRIETQIDYPTGHCRPDMRLTLQDDRVVLCEHKIDADETVGPDDHQMQLERYLDLVQVDRGICGLVYVRSSWKTPDADVLGHPLYLRPSAPDGGLRDHFLWRDFYSILAKNSEHLFIRWLQAGFEHLGFTPPPESIGALDHLDPIERRRNRQEFAKLWGSTRAKLREDGWRVTPGSVIQLYLTNKDDSVADQVIVSPLASSQRFWIRIRPRETRLLGPIENSVEKALIDHRASPALERIRIKAARGAHDQLQVVSSLWCVLDGATSGTQVERRLRDFVVPVVQAIPRR